ncbi:MAG: HlyD family efflux transporter periplasmic adaptor subunit [Lentimicrobiaceae bacterium]|jgi:HlyD family secretion protein|nr:HlyD family efflux transporter periplasmic adaptor subunit [Lentimicrobiaceae bacterium]MCP4909458.1 HlyD family efflux transporter periplasmic adaptor subunit [Bacteroidota bacterium]MBT3454122.1 HlyD family efflux transporter periplasmic adaptor subunit [Lentimicrobiaceae bacterium]MBT3819344.1 HlyD family efflux transporter periplasmic adaptor subunit [Lentimicrobiaceae bacterium]MBT4061017.1 HlyD family efflux transporter periplasmic adaptor subunit [Lentimicrobiaceae bacterium]
MAAKSKKRVWLLISIVVVVTVVTVLAIKKGNNSKSTKVATEFVELRKIVETVSANGKIQPAKDIKISPFISGEVVELYVKEGEFVEKGYKLARIDPEIYLRAYEKTEASLKTSQANQANSNARLSQSKAQFVKSELDFKRSKTLWDKKVISDSDFETAKSNYDVSKADVAAAKESYKSSQFQVSSARASLKEAKENLNRTTIYAPNDGTVSKLSVDVGERVTGASTFSAGTEIMRIADLDILEVNVEVNENDIVRVNLLDTAIIEVDAYLNRDFKGLVTEIATSANTVGVSADQVTNFDVKIKMLKPSYEDLIRTDAAISSPFRPGMSATVEIETETAVNIKTIAIQAVTTRADTSGRVKTAKEKREEERLSSEKGVAKSNDKIEEYVFLLEDGKAKLIKVKTGIQDNKYIEVTEGLKDGDEVIVAPYRSVSKTLKNNDDVEKVKKEELFKSDKDN